MITQDRTSSSTSANLRRFASTSNNLSIDSGWTFDTEADPTHGLVDFVSDTVAQVSQLAYVQSDNTVVVAVDDTTNLTAGANRNS